LLQLQLQASDITNMEKMGVQNCAFFCS